VTDVQITNWSADRIPELEPLWTALEEHHAQLGDVPPVRPLEDSWQRRQEQYREWLENGSGRLFVAERDGRALGYLMLTIGSGPPTWDVGDRAAEVETMAVLEGERSAGLGYTLLQAALRAAEAEGVQAVGVGVVHSNAGALAFYERAGFRPFYIQLLRVRR
jgi:ribosomal protein S18 acetylase RimI-like enzyme